VAVTELKQQLYINFLWFNHVGPESIRHNSVWPWKKNTTYRIARLCDQKQTRACVCVCVCVHKGRSLNVTFKV
jgi:hypothetical protein